MPPTDRDSDGGSPSRRESQVSGALRLLHLDAARWEAVLESARDGVISIDPDGTITLFNRSAEEIFGYRADEVLGRNVNLLMPAPYHEEHDGYLKRYRETGEAKAIGTIRHVHGKRKSGEVFPMELSVSEARIGDGVIYSAILRDVSERVRMQSELEAARETARQNERLIDIGAITLKIAHDLGNPVAGLQMQLWALLKRLERAPDQPIATLLDPLERMSSAVSRLDGLIQEFKTFAREQRLDLGDVDLPDFLRETVDAWSSEAVGRGIDLVLDPVPLAALIADASKLRRVMDNLVKNALEAIDHGPGTVRILLGAIAPARVRITIEDTGPGIPKGLDVFRLFETTKANGTGLGLSIARQIVLAHGGEIAVAPGSARGAAFHVELPAKGPMLPR